jgi:DNA-directed RNA polymerase subunit B'
MSEAFIYVNGRFVGTHKDPERVVKRLRELRRAGIIHSEVNVRFDPLTNEVFINTDRGRVRHPYIVVKDGKPLLDAVLLEKLKKGEISWDDLVKQGVIEYLDAEEEENAYIALSEDEVTDKHTHLEIDPSTIFGVVVSMLPYPEYNSSPRITMAASMAKQSLGLYAENYVNRFDTRVYVMYYPQKPMVNTEAYRALHMERRAAGQNAIVALIAYKGYNLEDAIIINKGAVDRGFARVAMFRTYETEEIHYPGGHKDKIEIPDPSVLGYRGEGAYSKLDEDGIVVPEVFVSEREVLVGKTSPPRFLEETGIFGDVEEKKRESSLSMKSGEEGWVDSVMITENAEGNKLVKVRIRAIKVPEVGDKFASRHGQKGVLGLILPQEDMPFTASGMVPDLIVNPHAIPSRMTAGHLLEMLGGKVGALYGEEVDATAFRENPLKVFEEKLEAMGYDRFGREVLYDPETGKAIEAEVYMGNIYYQRLHHLVSNKMHARSRGPVQLLTHQPTEGRSREGGLRFGEMERDCLIGYGVSLALKDRLMDESDRTKILVCKECGSTAMHDYARKRNVCPVCGSENVAEVEVTYAFKLLLDEIKSMGIFPRLKVEEKG